jgi:hypothetical protein
VRKPAAVVAAAAVAAEAVAVVVVAVSKEGGTTTLLTMVVAAVFMRPTGEIISLAETGAGIRRVVATLTMLRMPNFKLSSPLIGARVIVGPRDSYVYVYICLVAVLSIHRR